VGQRKTIVFPGCNTAAVASRITLLLFKLTIVFPGCNTAAVDDVSTVAVASRITLLLFKLYSLAATLLLLMMSGSCLRGCCLGRLQQRCSSALQVQAGLFKQIYVHSSSLAI
jgi:hypothetical protein